MLKPECSAMSRVLKVKIILEVQVQGKDIRKEEKGNNPTHQHASRASSPLAPTPVHYSVPSKLARGSVSYSHPSPPPLDFILPARDRTRATTRNVPTTIYITGTRTAVLEDHLSKAARKLVQRIEWNVVLTLFLARPSVCVMFLDMIYHYVLRREA